ncbi:protocadherin-like protein, partial [Plakobranchus ocellatus]
MINLGWQLYLHGHIYGDDRCPLPPQSCVVTVVIQDENDNAPVFASSVFDATVSENVKPGTSVAWVLVSDPDSAGSLALSLTGPDANMFRIEADGTVRSTQTLDYETKRRHLLTVVATDSVHTSRAEMDIRVRDENDHSPEFGSPEYSFEVSEAARPGYTIGQIKATDVDSGKNGRIVYSLDSEWGQEYFLLDNVHGTFTLIKELDFEERQVFTLTVIAKDEGTSEMSSEVKVFMNVKDANDNEPVFDPMTYYVEIFENAPVGKSLVDVKATDIDS